VAVVQISRIQVRRGQKNQGSGLPQLASGELGWAIDTRELFIGNGAVSEGAPAVGNTKVLTEYDNLFELADTYIYRAEDNYIVTGQNSTVPVRRSLQERLDDIVSVRSFGVKGDGVTIVTTQLQNAIDEIFINDANKTNPASRVLLHIEPGIYLIDDTITLPSYVSLIGAGKDKTIIKQTSVGDPIFRTVNSDSTPGSPASAASTTTLNQARDIRLEGMTLELTGTGKAIILENCTNSSFTNIAMEGTWEQVDALNAADVALEMISLSNEVETKLNNFIDCDINGFSYGIVSDWDIHDNTWSRCSFDTLGKGVFFGENTSSTPGQLTGPSYNHFINCDFSNINRQGIHIINGGFNISETCQYEFVGNDAGTEIQPVYPVIQYLKPTNKSINDWFSRTENLISGSGLLNVPYIPEVEGTAFFDLNFENSVTFGRLNNTRLFRLPGVINQSYDIDYTMVSQNYQAVRSGVLSVIINAYANPAEVEISDEYNFVGDAGSYLDAVTFDAEARDANSDLTPDTIDVKVTSTMPNDDQTEFKFVIKAKKTDVI